MINSRNNFFSFSHEYNSNSAMKPKIILKLIQAETARLAQSEKTLNFPEIAEITEKLSNLNSLLIPNLTPCFKNVPYSTFKAPLTANSTTSPTLTTCLKLQQELFFIAKNICQHIKQMYINHPLHLAYKYYFEHINSILIILQTIAVLGNSDIAYNLSNLFIGGVFNQPRFTMPLATSEIVPYGNNYEELIFIKECFNYFLQTIRLYDNGKYASVSFLMAEFAFKLNPLPEYSAQACVALMTLYSTIDIKDEKNFFEEISPYFKHFLLSDINNEDKVDILQHLKDLLTEKLLNSSISKDIFEYFQDAFLEYKLKFPEKSNNSNINYFLDIIEKLIGNSEISESNNNIIKI